MIGSLSLPFARLSVPISHRLSCSISRSSLGSSSSASQCSKPASSHFKGPLSYHAVSLPTFVLILSLTPSFCCLLGPPLTEAAFTDVSAGSLGGESGEPLLNQLLRDLFMAVGPWMKRVPWLFSTPCSLEAGVPRSALISNTA